MTKNKTVTYDPQMQEPCFMHTLSCKHAKVETQVAQKN